MPFDISKFSNQIGDTNGYLKTNKFHVRMGVPQLLLAKYPQALDVASTMEFYCQDAVLPGYQLMTGNTRRWTYGPNESRPFAPNFQQIQLLFNVDGFARNLEYFGAWLNTIIPHNNDKDFNSKSALTGGDKYTLSYKTEYACDMEIDVFDDLGYRVKTYYIKEAFPSNINQIQISWGDQNQIAQFTVFMEYLDYHTGPLSQDIYT